MRCFSMIGTPCASVEVGGKLLHFMENTAMKILKAKKLAMAAALTAGVVVSSQASAYDFLFNWTLDITGAGRTTGDGVTGVHEYLDLTGISYVDINAPVSATAFAFDDYGTMNFVTHDGGTAIDTLTGSIANQNLTQYELTAIFKLSGQVTANGSIVFDPYAPATTNYVEMWVGNSTTNPDSVDYGTDDSTNPGNGIYGANNGTLIATFGLVIGNGTADNNLLPNGTISIALEPLTLLAGYFKNSSGVDLSTLIDTSVVGDGPLFGFVTTNQSFVSNVSNEFDQEVVVGMAGDAACMSGTTNNCQATATDPRFVISNNGQYRWATVPEPGTLALMGAALFGAGLTRRRKVGKAS